MCACERVCVSVYTYSFAERVLCGSCLALQFIEQFKIMLVHYTQKINV